MEKEFQYIPPEESRSNESWRSHTLKINIDGKEVGSAEFIYYNKPFPLYYLRFLNIEEHGQGKGYGKELLHQVNDFITGHGKTGFLLDNIESDNPARGMYGRNGWEPVSKFPHWYVLNQKDISDEELHKAIKNIHYHEFHEYI